MSKLTTILHLKGVRYHSLHRNNRVWLDHCRLSFEKSASVKAHSTIGFDWGNRSPGTSQLALAICLEIYPRAVALKVYRDFKINVLLPIRDDFFEITLNLAAFNEVFVQPMVAEFAS